MRKSVIVAALVGASILGYGDAQIMAQNTTPATSTATSTVALVTTVDPINGATRTHAMIDQAARDIAAESIDATYGVSGLTLFCTGDYLDEMADDLGSEDSAAVAAIFAERDALGAPAKAEICQ